MMSILRKKFASSPLLSSPLLSSPLLVSISALLTVCIGSQVMAQMVPTAVPYNHLWDGVEFRLDNSMSPAVASAMVSAAWDYDWSTDLVLDPADSHFLSEVAWRNGTGRGREVQIVHEAPQWGSATWFNPPSGMASLPASGTVQTLVNYRVGNNLMQGIWISNQGWSRSVPIVNDVAQWGQATGWNGPISLSGLLGTGDIQAQATYIAGNNLMQGYWRNNEGWSRQVPVVNGVIQWGQATQWNGPISINGLPGNGDIQAQDSFVIANTFVQTIWRSNVQYTRYVSIVNGSVQFGAATSWHETTTQENIPGGGNVQAQGNYVLAQTGTSQGVLIPGTIRSVQSEYTYTDEQGHIQPAPYYAYTNPIDANGLDCYWWQGMLNPFAGCNTTNHRAVKATIYYNTLQQPWPNHAYLTRHEL